MKYIIFNIDYIAIPNMQHETLKRSLRHSSESSPVNPFFWGTDGQRRPPKPWPDSPSHHHFAWIFATSQIRKGVPLRTVGWREMSMLRCCVCIIDILGYFSDAGSLTVRVLFLQPRYKVLGVWEFPMQALGLTTFKSMSGFDTICYQYVDFEARDEHCENAAWSSDCSVFFCGQSALVPLKTQKLSNLMAKKRLLDTASTSCPLNHHLTPVLCHQQVKELNECWPCAFLWETQLASHGGSTHEVDLWLDPKHVKAFDGTAGCPLKPCCSQDIFSTMFSLKLCKLIWFIAPLKPHLGTLRGTLRPHRDWTDPLFKMNQNDPNWANMNKHE